jgi:integrase
MAKVCGTTKANGETCRLLVADDAKACKFHSGKVVQRAKRTNDFGTIRRLPSGRYQVRYQANGERLTARDDAGKPVTFGTKRDATAWLSEQRTDIRRGHHRDARAGAEPFGNYAERWLAERRKADGRELKPRTVAHYQTILDRYLLPKFEHVAIGAITKDAVRQWHANVRKKTGPTMAAHSYGMLRTVLGTAVADEAIQSNPCQIRGAGSVVRESTTEPATVEQLDVIVANMPERLQLMIQLAAWCALRFGELAELRRKDITIDGQKAVVSVRRGVVSVKGGRVVGTPKSDAGTRTVAVPPELLAALSDHLAEHTQPGADGLLFPGVGGAWLATRTLYDSFYKAREAAGRPDLRFHDLRHTGLTFAAEHGATLAQLMRRGGHSTPTAALRYQHATDRADEDLAKRLMAPPAKVVPIRAARRRRAQ